MLILLHEDRSDSDREPDPFLVNSDSIGGVTRRKGGGSFVELKRFGPDVGGIGWDVSESVLEIDAMLRNPSKDRPVLLVLHSFRHNHPEGDHILLDPREFTSIRRIDPKKNRKYVFEFTLVEMQDGRSFQLVETPEAIEALMGDLVEVRRAP